MSTENSSTFRSGIRQNSQCRSSGELHYNTGANVSRREFLQTAGGGLGGLALTALLANEVHAEPHHAPKAKRVIQIFCPGGISHVDTFDY